MAVPAYRALNLSQESKLNVSITITPLMTIGTTELCTDNARVN